MDYGDIIKAFRHEAGMTTEQLADLVSVNKETVNRVELNRNPRIETLRKIAHGLGLTLAGLFRAAEGESVDPRAAREGASDASTAVQAHQQSNAEIVRLVELAAHAIESLRRHTTHSTQAIHTATKDRSARKTSPRVHRRALRGHR
jgi:transcriptional regulator with XRE-family HTH domain